MRIEEFNYILPAELIAQSPLKNRGDSRLLVANPVGKKISDSYFKNFTALLKKNDLVIFNDTRVIKARIFGTKTTGGKVELLIERILNNHTATALIRTSKRIDIGLTIAIDCISSIKVISRNNNLFEIQLLGGSFYDLLEKHGHVPLPPYIERNDEDDDEIRYQTVFAKEAGAVAAPTAGLHFSEQDLRGMDKKGIATAFITLHVGSGTFQPIKTEDINQHIMHQEIYNIPKSIIKKIAETKAKNGRIVAIGTTVLRALESAYEEDIIKTGYNETGIFIKPGFNFKVVDALFTNFHLPKSTLLMLVSAFAGSKFIKAIYRHAVHNKYRFFSYGDAMFIEQKVKNQDEQV